MNESCDVIGFPSNYLIFLFVFVLRGQNYKTFYGRNLRMSAISLSVIGKPFQPSRMLSKVGA